MHYVILQSKCSKTIIKLLILLAVALSFYGMFVVTEFETFVKVFTSIPNRFFIMYHLLLVIILVLFMALYYLYGYKEGLRIGRDVTQS